MAGVDTLPVGLGRSEATKLQSILMTMIRLRIQMNARCLLERFMLFDLPPSVWLMLFLILAESQTLLRNARAGVQL